MCRDHDKKMDERTLDHCSAAPPEALKFHQALGVQATHQRRRQAALMKLRPRVLVFAVTTRISHRTTEGPVAHCERVNGSRFSGPRSRGSLESRGLNHNSPQKLGLFSNSRGALRPSFLFGSSTCLAIEAFISITCGNVLIIFSPRIRLFDLGAFINSASSSSV